MGMGGGGGGSSQPQVQPQNNTTVMRAPPWAEDAVRTLLERAEALSQQPHQPYEGTRIAPLTPTHTQALSQAREMLYGPGGPGQRAIESLNGFASGAFNQPAYVHPYLGPPVLPFGDTAPAYSPTPWGVTGPGGGGGVGLPSPASGSVPPPASVVPSAAPPIDISTALPVAPPVVPAATAARQADAGANKPPQSMWIRGAGEAEIARQMGDNAYHPANDPNDVLSDQEWGAFLTGDYGYRPGDHYSPTWVRNDLRGYGLSLDDAPSRSEFRQLQAKLQRDSGRGLRE